MRTVWKYTLPIEERPCIDMKKGAEIIHVDCQIGVLCIWAIVETEQEDIKRFFRIYGTGHNLANMIGHNKFVGTAIDRGSGFVWHVWTD